MKYSKGIMWLDDCRIPTTEILGREQKSSNTYAMLQGGYNDGFWDNTKGLGRFTPNLLVCDDMLNDGSVSKSQRGRNDVGKPTYTGNSLLNSKTTMNNTDRGFDDKGSNSRYYDLDLWFDKMLEKL
jgi:hypothetical protein